MTDIHARLGELNSAQRKILAARLKAKVAAAGGAGDEETRVYPASFAQRRLWLLDRLQPGSRAYNMPGGWLFRGPLDVEALERALDELVRRHGSLRTRLEARGDDLVQVVLPHAPPPLERVDLSGRPADERQAELARLAREHAERPFRLDGAPLLRAALVRVADDEHALLWTVHHAVSDGWSANLMARELGTLYASFSTGLPSPLPAPGLPYGEHAARERERLSGAALERLVGFWRHALAGAPVRLELPTDFPRPAMRSPRGGVVAAPLAPGVAAGVEALAHAEGATPFMVYMAAFQLLLGRYARQRDVVVGTVVANRASPEVEGTVGFFVNTLALRGDLGGTPSFRALVARTRDATLAAYDHQELPFEKLVEEVNPERSLSFAPLVQAVLILHNQGAPPPESEPPPMAADEAGAGLRVASLSAGVSAARFDLSLSVQARSDGAGAWLNYAADLWEPATAERMLARFAALLAAALADPDASAWELPLFVDAAERERVAGEWAGRPAYFARGAAFPARFAEQARRTPDASAVESPGLTLTYAQLDAATARLARWLIARGVGPESRVGIGLERTAELVVAIVGTLRAGAAFVPLDPAHPRERLAGLMDAAGISIVLTTTELLGRLPYDPRVVAIDAIASDLDSLSPDNPGVAVDPSSLAYVLYTSGSTGRPKGVMVEHGSLSAYLEWVDRALYRQEVETMPVVTRPGFDAILKQLFPPLLRGGAVWLPGEETASDPAALMAALGGRRAVALSCVPSLWSALLDAADQGRAPLPAPHTLLAITPGGERLDASLVSRTRARLPHLRIVNLYGPTEITANATHAEVGTETVVPIGVAVDGASVYVVDEAMRLLPGDLPGELVIGGAGVARGYLGAPALTAERFVPDPFSPVPGARLYRSGDQARRRADGRIDYLGRMDDQVKVRGVRVEPGEVEAALRALPGVRDAAVAALDDGRGGARLAAYVVSEASEASPSSLRAALSARLPEAMVPTAFVLLDALPRTPNGKVDRRALPAPDPAAGEDEWVEPSTDTERRVADIWAQVIGVERVGAGDDFFLLGGHSLLATQVVARVREAFRVELPLRTLFEAPRLSAFAARVDAAAGHEAGVDEAIEPRGGNDLPLSFAQERLWFIDRMDPGSTVYNIATPLRLAGPLDVRALERALSEMVRRHEVLRTRFAVVDGAPVQRIEPPETFRLAHDDLSALPEGEREARLAELAAAEARTPFDLEAGPLFRARLVRASADDHLLLVGMHHAITDGWGSGVFWRELVTLYGAFSRGGASPLPALPVRYADFAAWQREWLRGERLEAQVAWWREHLAGAPAVLALPTDRPRPPAQSHRGARVSFSLSPDEAGGCARWRWSSAPPRSWRCWPPSGPSCRAGRGRTTWWWARRWRDAPGARWREWWGCSSTLFPSAPTFRATLRSARSWPACARPRWAPTPTRTSPSSGWWRSWPPSAP
jgi:amino acid adenylation domain-containing protein